MTAVDPSAKRAALPRNRLRLRPPVTCSTCPVMTYLQVMVMPVPDLSYVDVVLVGI